MSHPCSTNIFGRFVTRMAVAAFTNYTLQALPFDVAKEFGPPRRSILPFSLLRIGSRASKDRAPSRCFAARLSLRCPTTNQ
jgi:hypothetical protein